MKFKEIFITGATGLIGTWTVAKLTREGHKVFALARNAQQRKASYLQWVEDHGGIPSQVILLDGDLTQPQFGLSAEQLSSLKNVDVIYHMGAAFDWGLTAKQAQQITVVGSRTLITIAKDLPRLEQIIHLSGYMLAAPHIWELLGLNPNNKDSAINLSATQRQSIYKKFGAYEAAKIEAEFELNFLAKQNNIPITGILLSSVAGHSETGEINQPHGVPSLIQSIYEKNFPFVPGTPNDWLPLVSIDFLVDFITGILSLPETIGQDFVVLDKNTPNFPEMVSQLCQHMGVRPPRGQISKSLLKFLLNMGMDRITGNKAESLDFLQPYRYDTTAMETVIEKLNLSIPDINLTLKRTADYVLSNMFNTEKYEIVSGKYITTGNTQTYFKLENPNRGEQEDTQNSLVMLHGIPFTNDSWQQILPLLPGKKLLLDLPNISRSRGNEEIGPRWLDNSLSSINQTNSQTILVGHSLGSGLALEYAHQHPDKVKGLILISPYFLQQAAPAMVEIPYLSKLLRATLSKEQFDQQMLGKLAIQKDLQGLISHSYYNAKSPDVLDHIFKELKKSRKESRRQELQELLDQSAIPTLILHGSEDPLITLIKRTQHLATNTISGAGHNPHISHPKETAVLINRFLNLHFNSSSDLNSTEYQAAV